MAAGMGECLSDYWEPPSGAHGRSTQTCMYPHTSGQTTTATTTPPAPEVEPWGESLNGLTFTSQTLAYLWSLLSSYWLLNAPPPSPRWSLAGPHPLLPPQDGIRWFFCLRRGSKDLRKPREATVDLNISDPFFPSAVE